MAKAKTPALSASARAKKWLERQRVIHQVNFMEIGECTICGYTRERGHDPERVCGIVHDLVLALALGEE